MRVDFKIIGATLLAVILFLCLVSEKARAENSATVTGGQNQFPEIFERGGPDGGGYYYLDSPDSAFNAPQYHWKEISGYGSDMAITLDDQNIGPFPIGFTFGFYGANYNTFRACSNGFISFTSTSNEWINDTIPSPAEPNNFIAVYWDDLVPSTGHAFYYSNNFDTLIVEWKDFVNVHGTGPVTFEVILNRNGNITCQYQSIGTPINSHTIGIENAAGTIGLEYVANVSKDETGKAIQFTRVSANYNAHNVLLIAADSIITQLPSGLLSYGDINSITIFDARYATPQLSYLQNFEAVVVWSNYNFFNSVDLGNVLADYLESGRAVILYNFCFYSNYRLQGRLIDQYSPFNYVTTGFTTRSLDLNPFIAGHPIFAGVDSISERFSFDLTLAHDPMLIANYIDGVPFVVADRTHKLVAINGTVVDVRSFTDDIVPLTHNAINFALSNPAQIVFLIADYNATAAKRDLLLYPDIHGVDIFDVRLGMPTADYLNQYQAAVVWSNYVFLDSAGLGNTLADYVDYGHGVVLANFDFFPGAGLGGRIMSSYAPLGFGNIRAQTRGLGAHNNNNPLMAGVDTVTEYWTCGASLQNGGINVASWDDGSPFVAYNPTRRVVGVNGHIGRDRRFTGDMPAIIHNAVNYARGYIAVDENPDLPDQFQLIQNYPNPFNATTTISYNLSKDSDVKLEIFNLLGQKIITLVNNHQRVGWKRIIWDGRDAKGVAVASGVYFYKLDAEKNQATMKMLLLK